MDSLGHPTVKLPPEPEPHPQVLRRLRAWLRSRTGRVIFPIATFVAGMLTALIIVLLVILSFGGDEPTISNPVVSGGDIVIEIGPSYITHLVAQNLQTAGLPGTVKNVQVTLASGDRMTVQGDDQFSMLGISFTRRLTVILQPYTRTCQLQVRVTHADLQGIDVTHFAANFQGQINNQLRVNTGSLPQGFTYCDVGVRTTPSGLFVTYIATPIGDIHSFLSSGSNQDGNAQL
ncbi:MAG TPA: hypothetical protein VKV40_16695 [Ktedonobacteraceae bacterium]|nr:hypothetical protein [Ktedonobacteraceae bacterium]